MFITVVFLILAQACGKQGQKFILPLTDLYSHDIARSGYDIFWKVDARSQTTLVSSYPVKKNAVTKVTFLLLSGGSFLIGCGKKSKIVKNQYIGQFPESVAYFAGNGRKYKQGDSVDYSTPSSAGDNVTMIIDTRQNYDSISFERNKLPLGVAYSGLTVQWGDLFIMFGIQLPGDKIKIVNYQVIE